MEQQLYPQLPKNSLRVNRDEDEEEETGAGLLTRHPTNRIRADITCGELAPSPSSAPTSGTTSDHSIQEEEEEEEDEATAGDIHRNEELIDENGEDDVLKREGERNGNIVHFDKFQGTKSINRFYEIPKILSMEANNQQVKNVDGQSFGLSRALVGQLNEETNKSTNHFDCVIKVDTNADLAGEIEEDLMELDVKTVLEKQSTHDLYCPNCNSCITRKVILVRRKPKFLNIHHKPKHLKKLNSTDDGHSGCTPETHANVSPILAPGEQNNSREQEQEAFSCFSCFSLFIPIGNGCFKIFQFFKQGRQNELTLGPQDISQREHTQISQERNQWEDTQSTQGRNLSQSTQSPYEISQMEKTQRPQGISPNENTEPPQKVSDNETNQRLEKGNQEENIHNPQHKNHDEDAEDPQQGICKIENTETPRKFSDNEDTKSPQKASHEANKLSSQHLNHNEDIQGPHNIICNEDASATFPQTISYNASKQGPRDINQNENKQSPRKIPTASTNWIISFFGFHKGKETIEKNGKASFVQSAAAPIQSVTAGKHIDGVVRKSKGPGISNVFSSTNSSLCDNVKAESREQKFDADMLQRKAGYNETEDLEAGLVEPKLYRSTEVAPSSQSGTQNESTGSDAGEAHEWEILKSIVYGGLIESITSLGVVSSAAGAGVDTLKTLAFGLANVIGGLVILSHNIRELKNDRPHGAFTEIDIEEDRYRAVLGRRENIVLHVIVAIISFLVLGIVPPVVYGFSFPKSDDKGLKFAVTEGASLVCIILLALGKAQG